MNQKEYAEIVEAVKGFFNDPDCNDVVVSSFMKAWIELREEIHKVHPEQKLISIPTMLALMRIGCDRFAEVWVD